MGAKISGERTGTITVTGVEKLFPTNHATAGDRICAGTYLAAAAASGGEIEITGVEPVIPGGTVKGTPENGSRIRIFGAAGPKGEDPHGDGTAPGWDHDRYRTISGFSDGSAVGLSRSRGGGNRGEPVPGDRVRGDGSRRRCGLQLFGADVSVQEIQP